MRSLARVGMGAAVGLAALLAGGLTADEAKKQVDLKVGDPAPLFTSTDDQGRPWKLSDHLGKGILVLYFYPADMTGGCTMQACGFRDDMKQLADRGVQVVGVSGDSPENHQVFKKFHHLPFTLLADEHGAVARKYGVPVKEGGVVRTKDIEGNPVTLRRGVTAQRWTFVIGRDGKILFKEQVKAPAEDSKRILEVVEKQEK